MRVQTGLRTAMVLIVSTALVAACSGRLGGLVSSSALLEERAGSEINRNAITVDAMIMYDSFKDKPWGEDPVTRRLTELTGVQFEFSGPEGNGDEKANVMLLSGDYPEVMWMDRGPIWDKYVNSGALYAIDELAETYGYDNLIGRYIPQHVVDNLKHPDGHIYGIPNWFNDRGELSVGKTLMVRNDIYRGMGSPEINTVSDLEQFLRRVRDADLTFQGAKVYPLGLDFNEGWLVELGNLWGSRNKDYRYFDERERKVKFFLYNEPSKKALRWLNRMYREGMIDPDNFSFHADARNEAYSEGKFAASFGVFWDYWAPNEGLKRIDPQVYYKAIPAPAGEEGVKPYLQGYSTVGWNVAVITKNAKNPDAIMRYFNYYMSPPGQILSFYGIEGETWELANGEPTLNEDVYAEFRKEWPSPSFALRTGVRYLELNQNQQFNWEKRSESSDRQEDRRAAEATAFDGTALSVLSLDPQSRPGIAWANIKARILDDLTKIIISPSEEEAEARIAELLRDYEQMGIGGVEKAWTKQYFAREALKNDRK